jgi:hypothetical protein
VHFDGAGNATATTDSEDASGTLGTGTVNTLTATQNGSGSPTFLIQADAGDFWLMTLISPTKAVFAAFVSLTNYPDLYLLEK